MEMRRMSLPSAPERSTVQHQKAAEEYWRTKRRGEKKKDTETETVKSGRQHAEKNI